MMRHLLLCVTVIFVAVPSASAVTVFSEGMDTPETISQIPSTFSSTLAGDYLVPDAQGGIIWQVPAGGGAPRQFAQVVNERTLGGMFLPDSGWGAYNGQYITVGSAPDNFNYGRIYVHDAAGASTQVAELPEGGAYLSVPRVAPAGFGSHAGKLVISAQGLGLYTYNLADGFQHFVSPPKLGYFGTAFAPAGFGVVGGTLLAEVVSGEIYSIQPDGTTMLFTAVPLYEGQGTRQMTFAPAGFLASLGIDEAVLLISVAGSSVDDDPLGDVLAIDAVGDVVASLRVADDLAKFNPRGLLVVGQDLLISDVSDPIIAATAGDFRLGRDANLIPEPTSLALIGMGGLLIAMRRRT